jgi:hypothetical protein
LKVRNYSPSDIDAGREYVRAYVTFIHYVERAYEAASHPVSGHFAEEEQVPEKHDR